MTALICLGCGLLTLLFMFSGTLANQRAAQLRKDRKPTDGDLALRLLASLSGWLPNAEINLRSEIVRRGRMAPMSPDLVFLAVDDLSIGIEPLDLEANAKDIPPESNDFRALNLMSQGWPFDREVHALAIEKLIQAGARAVLVDFIFVKPSAGDRPLKSVLERHRDKVTVVCNFVPPTGEGGITSGAGKNAIQMPPSSLLPVDEPRDVIGLANFFPDPIDGNIWAARYRISERELANYPPAADGSDEYLALSAKAVAKIGLARLIPAGTRPTPFRYAGAVGTFKPRSFQEIFFPRIWEANYRSGAFFKDKLVVLGPFGNWAQDFQPTPLGTMPGPEVHLHALNALLSQSFLRETPLWLAVLEVILACAGVAALSFTRLRPGVRFLLAVGVGALLVAAAAAAYNRFDTYLLTASPLFALVACSFSVFVHEFALERLERARTRKFLERSMSANLVRAVLDQPGFYEKMRAGQRMPVSILFSDIRSFTTMTESADEAALVVQLNEYMDRMVECVFKHNGTLDKFIGDAVMAVWGNTPTTKGPREDACDAVRCALEMLERLRELNVRWKSEGRPELHIGIGVNSGEVIVGEIGSSQKMEITVIGDAVNTASRFEGLTKEYHLELLIGENTAAHVRDRFVLQHADFNMPKGKTRQIEIFTVLGEDLDGARARWQAAGLADYEAGLRAYRERVAAKEAPPGEDLAAYRHRLEQTALAAFTAAAAARPGDFLSERYARITAANIAGGEQAVWSEVTVMTKK
ncbi:MAG: adenylate/guanylate cyclase domain-containing protein [Verrucomicrobia bacterium]|nr:adenylate/guanylate cyclase domain-containing protein [Verrucomicrobiota bacterium]